MSAADLDYPINGWDITLSDGTYWIVNGVATVFADPGYLPFVRSPSDVVLFDSEELSEETQEALKLAIQTKLNSLDLSEWFQENSQ